MFMEYLPTEMEEKSEYGEFFSFSSPLTFLQKLNKIQKSSNLLIKPRNQILLPLNLPTNFLPRRKNPINVQQTFSATSVSQTDLLNYIQRVSLALQKQNQKVLHKRILTKSPVPKRNQELIVSLNRPMQPIKISRPSGLPTLLEIQRV